MDTALRALQQGNMDVLFLLETKLKQVIHIQRGAGYQVWVTEAYSRHLGVVAVF